MRRRGIIAGSIGAALLGAAAMRGVLRRFEIRESSMEPALEPGDWVLGRRHTGSLARGDIVVFDDPTGTGMNLVKRVIGLPGESLAIENGRVTINGAVRADGWANGVSGPDGEWEVADHHIWVLGDNRPHSRSDSRLWGPIPAEAATWQIVARYWPTSRTGAIA